MGARVVLVAVIAMTTVGVAVAAPVDPKALPGLAVASSPGEAATIASAGADADLVLFALGIGDFVAVAGAHPLAARIDASLPAAFDAIAGVAGAVKLPHAAKGEVDLERYDAPAAQVLRELADAAGASYVFAPAHVLPALTVRAHRADARDTMRAVATLLELVLIEDHGVWVIAEPRTRLDAVIAGHVRTGSRLEIEHAHPGEARRVLEPDEPQARNTCPAETWVDASLHGEVGVLEAVLDTLGGPPCEQHPDRSALDTGTASLVGVLVEPHARRAVFRVPGGARVFEPDRPDRGARIEINYVVVGQGSSTLRIAPQPPTPSLPAILEDDALRATVRIGTRWSALVRSSTGRWRIVRPPGVEISAGSVVSGDQTLSLEH